MNGSGTHAVTGGYYSEIKALLFCKRRALFFVVGLMVSWGFLVP